METEALGSSRGSINLPLLDLGRTAFWGPPHLLPGFGKEHSLRSELVEGPVAKTGDLQSGHPSYP